MQVWSRSLGLGWKTAMVLVLCIASSAAGELWVTTPSNGPVAVQAAPGRAPALAVNDQGQTGFDVAVTTEGLSLEPCKTKGGEFVRVQWPDASMSGEVGTPALPVVRRLFAVPNGASVTVSATMGSPVTIDSTLLNTPLRVIPVQPPIEKTPGAADRAKFQFNEEAYSVNFTAPSDRVIVQEGGIARGQQLYVLEVRPVAYNAAAQKLTIWPELNVEVRFSRTDAAPSALKPLPGLRSIVLNPAIVPQVAQRGSGNYLIVAAPAYVSAISSFASAKQAQGFTVTTHSAESTKEAIKTYIQSLWGGASAPDYILLVGDTDTIGMWTGGGEGSPSTDIQYACMDGTSDWYPDIAIGRFSVQSTAQLSAIVAKTLLYENGPLPDAQYLKRAVFMASEDNYTVSEGTHNWVIENYMLPNEIVSDKLYCHTYGATPAQVSAAFNNGRVFGIYSGHGGETYWADGPVFYQSDVNALTNVGMYPIVYSFACVTGTLTVSECYMETWQRAANKAGVIAIGSSVNSYWTEDDMLEKKLFDSIYDENDSVVPEVGPVWNDAKMRYLSVMGTGSTTRRYFEMYNILGDPALEYPGNCSDAGTVALDRTNYKCQSTVTITIGDCGLNTNDNVVETVTINVKSTTQPAGRSVVLTETSAGSAKFVGTVNLGPSGSTVLQVSEGDTVTATYVDANNGQGGTNVTVTATALVDCTAPTISNVQTSDVQAHSAVVSFTSNEDARGIIHYGTSCGNLTQTASGGYSSSPTVTLSGINHSTTYFYSVEAEDLAGNSVTDDNLGACYSFATPEIPDYFTQLFTSDNDLDNLSLKFTPNGGNGFYDGCAEAITSLPTDPAGGTTISSWTGSSDDGNAQLTLTGGQVVKLYGQNYSTFWVGTNGYITFSSGDTTYTEALAAHFNQPRISALFNDLDPGQGGTVSWKQLADRAVVTWLNVPHHSVSNTNTFQIEMFFDGRLAISFLAIGDTDGLAGLSAGGGQPADYTASDLSTMGTCGPKPPTANNVSATTPLSTPVTLTLAGTDDGLPNPPAAMSYIISVLPAHGSLSDPNGGAITTVPYTLLSGGKRVAYTPVTDYRPSDTFKFKVNDGGTAPEGGDSNEATATVGIGGSAYDPVAHDVSLSVAASSPSYVTLNATDPNSDVLTYTIETLPAAGKGLLFDPNGGQIMAVPYTLLNGGKIVKYIPPYNQALSASFTYSAKDATAKSNIATVSLTVGAAVSQLVHEYTMSTNPGWSTTGLWAFGTPTGGGTHNKDPNSGHTGTNVYGYNLSGDYTKNMPARYLTTTAISCANVTGVELKFWRWLGVDAPAYAKAVIEVSTNGTTWTQVWQNGLAVADTAWSQQTYNISAVADNQPTVYIRWTMGPTTSSATNYPGWNIDDVEIWGVMHNTCEGVVEGDVNGDGLANGLDVQPFVQMLMDPYGQGVTFAAFCAADMNADGFMTTDDVAGFVQAILNP